MEFHIYHLSACQSVRPSVCLFICPTVMPYVSLSYKLYLHLRACLKINQLYMKTIHYPNKISSHLATLLPMASFTLKLSSNLRSALTLDIR